MTAVHKALFSDQKKAFFKINAVPLYSAASQKFTVGMPQNSSNATLHDLIVVLLNFSS